MILTYHEGHSKNKFRVLHHIFTCMCIWRVYRVNRISSGTKLVQQFHFSFLFSYISKKKIVETGFAFLHTSSLSEGFQQYFVIIHGCVPCSIREKHFKSITLIDSVTFTAFKFSSLILSLYINCIQYRHTKVLVFLWLCTVACRMWSVARINMLVMHVYSNTH